MTVIYEEKVYGSSSFRCSVHGMDRFAGRCRQVSHGLGRDERMFMNGADAAIRVLLSMEGSMSPDSFATSILAECEAYKDIEDAKKAEASE